MQCSAINKRFFLIIFLWLIPFSSVSAQNFWFQPQVAVLGGYTAYLGSGERCALNREYHFHIRTNHFGLELNNLFHFRNSNFIHAGFRFQQYQSRIADFQYFNSIQSTIPVELNWTLGSLSVPLLIGKEFVMLHQLKPVKVYAGMSAGVLMQTEIGSGGSSEGSYVVQIIADDNFQQSFFLTVDAGADLAPFRKLPDLSIGILITAQLNDNTFYNDYDGSVSDLKNNINYPISISIKPFLLSFSIKAAYTFLKQNQTKHKRHKTGSMLRCPDLS
jgi:hypothetical protein